MKKNEIREYLNDYAWLNNNNYGTHTLHLFYKNYCIVINGYWEYYNKLEIIIYKFNEKFTNITIAYHNDNIEEIHFNFVKLLQREKKGINEDIII